MAKFNQEVVQMWIKYNPNPESKKGIDCTVRAISKALGKDWDTTYWELCAEGAILKEMPVADNVWGNMLKQYGFRRHVVPDSCPTCYTVEQFCRDHAEGTYILAVPNHVVCAVDGDYYDFWDSGREVPIYYWQREAD